MLKIAVRSMAAAGLLGCCWGLALAAAHVAHTPAATTPDVEKNYSDLMGAKHKLASDSDELPAADAARFKAALADAVALYSNPPDPKSGALGLRYMFSYCEHPPADMATKCETLKRQGHVLVMHQYVSSPGATGSIMFSTAEDLPFLGTLFGQTPQRSLVAQRAGELWLQRYNDPKSTPSQRRKAQEEVFRYVHALKQDPMPRYRLNGEGLENALQFESAGKVFPDFGWTSLTGDKVSLGQHRGKVLLLDFWATWCVPCVASMPHIAELRAKLAGKPFEVISINAQGGDVNDVIRFQGTQVSMPWTNWRVDTQSDEYFRIGLTALPTYFVLDEEGKVLYRANQFDAAIQERIRAAVAAAAKG